MGSIVLTIATRMLAPLLLLVSLFLLLRGHDAPGGGFSGALVGASAASLLVLAAGPDDARRLLRLHPRTLLAAGLALALGSAVVGLVAGDGLFVGVWLPWKLPLLGGISLGTPILFDVGVYLVTGGTLLLLLDSLGRE